MRKRDGRLSAGEAGQAYPSRDEISSFLELCSAARIEAMEKLQIGRSSVFDLRLLYTDEKLLIPEAVTPYGPAGIGGLGGLGTQMGKNFDEVQAEADSENERRTVTARYALFQALQARVSENSVYRFLQARSEFCAAHEALTSSVQGRSRLDRWAEIKLARVAAVVLHFAPTVKPYRWPDRQGLRQARKHMESLLALNLRDLCIIRPDLSALSGVARGLGAAISDVDRLLAEPARMRRKDSGTDEYPFAKLVSTELLHTFGFCPTRSVQSLMDLLGRPPANTTTVARWIKEATSQYTTLFEVERRRFSGLV